MKVTQPLDAELGDDFMRQREKEETALFYIGWSLVFIASVLALIYKPLSGEQHFGNLLSWMRRYKSRMGAFSWKDCPFLFFPSPGNLHGRCGRVVSHQPVHRTNIQASD